MDELSSHRMHALQSELNYTRGVVKEQSEIIKQLVDGPGEFEYIHPADFGALLNSLPLSELVIYSDGILEPLEHWPSGKKYKQSVHIPARIKF